MPHQRSCRADRHRAVSLAHFTQDPGMYECLSKPQPTTRVTPRWLLRTPLVVRPAHDPDPLVGLVAVGLWLLVGKVTPSDGTVAPLLAWISRIATFVFIVYYTAWMRSSVSDWAAASS